MSYFNRKRLMAGGFTAGLAGVVIIGMLAGGGAGFIASPAPPSTCSNAGERPEWDGSAWQCRVLNDYRGKHFEWNDEWWFRACANGSQCGSIWGLVVAGSGAAVNGAQGTTTRPGILEITTGTTTTGSAYLFPSLSSIDFGSNTSTVYEFVGGFPTLSTVGEEFSSLIGLADSGASANTVDGCWFQYDRLPAATAPGTGTITAGSNTWQCWCASNSVRTGYTMDGAIVSDGSFTTVAAPVAALTLPSTNISHLKVVVTGSTLAEFYVNGVKSCQITTNIPSGASRLTGPEFGILKSAGSTARLMDIDFTRLSVDLSAARSP